jgi:hypothetical protein
MEGVETAASSRHCFCSCFEFLDVEDAMSSGRVDCNGAEQNELDSIQGVQEGTVGEDDFGYWIWKVPGYVMFLEGCQDGDV